MTKPITGGGQQLLGYMADYHQDTGYLLIFNFNQSKEPGIKEVKINGQTLIEVTVWAGACHATPVSGGKEIQFLAAVAYAY